MPNGNQDEEREQIQRLLREQNSPDEAPEEKQEGKTGLESVLDELGEFGRKVRDYGLGIGAAAGTTAYLGLQNGAKSFGDVVNKGRDGIIVPTSYAAGEKCVKGKEFTSAHFRDEMLSGAAQTAAIIYPAYKYMNLAQEGIVSAVQATQYAQYAGIVGAVGRSILNVPLYFPLSIFGYHVANHVIKKRTFRGLYSETLKPNFKDDLVNAYKYFTIPVLLNALFMPAALQVPGAALLTFAYKLFMARKEKTEGAGLSNLIPRINIGDYARATSSLIYKGTRNVVGGLSEAITGISTGIRDWYKSRPKPSSATPQPEPAPS